jgi:hypothetical protein
MRIELKRIYTCATYTIGHLYVNGEYVCDTVEDTDRGLHQGMTAAQIRKVKVYRQTAIPTGTYKVTMNVQSPKFAQYEYYKKFCNGYLPRLLNVPGFDGILIHKGVSANSSAGCIIVGYNTIKGRVTDSQKAWEKLMKKYLMPAKVLGESIEIVITSNYKK